MRERWSRVCVVFVGVMAAMAAAAQEPAPTPEPGVLLGFVDDTAKRPLAGISVAVSDPADPEWTLREITDDGGAFSITTDRTDRALALELTGAGFQPFTSEVRLKPGKEKKLGFKLKPVGTKQADPLVAEAYRRGVEAKERGDGPAAIEAWSEALAADPEMTAAAAELAEALLAQRRHAEAKQAAEKLLELSPGAPVGLDVLFHSARALGDQAAALRAAAGMKDTSRGRELANEVSNDGVAAARDGDLETAKRSYELAIAMDSRAAAPLANLAIIRHFDGQPQESLELLDRLLALVPKEPNGLEYRYLNLCALGEEDEADKAFETLQVEKAREHLERFVKLAPNAPQTAAVEEMVKALK